MHCTESLGNVSIPRDSRMGLSNNPRNNTEEKVLSLHRCTLILEQSLASLSMFVEPGEDRS